ncbi:MAG: hypothetical protein ACRD0P_08820 [Stackebrandtia sp.]
MTDSSGWAAPGAGGAPAAHWPHRSPVTAVNGQRRPSGTPPRAIDETLARPSFREPHRSTSAGIFSGAAIAVVWFVITTFLGTDLTSVLWVMLAASLVATGAALLLARYGDRGAAAGVAAVSGAAVAVVGLVVEWHHLLNETWVLW